MVQDCLQDTCHWHETIMTDTQQSAQKVTTGTKKPRIARTSKDYESLVIE